MRNIISDLPPSHHEEIELVLKYGTDNSHADLTKVLNWELLEVVHCET